jgi:hypothetical protein
MNRLFTSNRDERIDTPEKAGRLILMVSDSGVS